MNFALLNLSPVSDGDMVKICEALQLSADQFCADWDLTRDTFIYVPGLKEAPVGMVGLASFKDADVAGAEGYHMRDPQGRPFGKSCNSVIPGGRILHDETGQGQCVLAVLDHEYKEIRQNPYANRWVDGPVYDPETRKWWAQICHETADPVQGSSYTCVLKDGTLVTLSNYVLATYFDPEFKGRVDRMGVLPGPLTIAADSYAIVRDEAGNEGQILAASLPAWRLEHSNLPFGRKRPAKSTP